MTKPHGPRINSQSIKPKAGDPAGAMGIHGDPVAGVTC